MAPKVNYRDLQDLVSNPSDFRSHLQDKLDVLDLDEQDIDPELKPAAVLAPVVIHRGQPSFLFLRRPESMREHKGQIAFPGGRLDAGETLAECAVREANEELGIDAHMDHLLGRVPGIPTITNYWVSPIVAWIDEEPTIVPNTGEVAEYFYAPLAELLNPEIYEGNPVEWKGQKGFIDYFHFPHESGQTKIIWGATGRMLHQFFDKVLDWVPPR